ncbi:MAG: hypothetical protein L6R36_001901 [Xanthoria steineri]|nr:MAG: hypothetical protein L6R36_001901 [Xanthoria steineri]
MMLFGLGNLFYVSILLVNAVAILSEDRFLARSTSVLSLLPPPSQKGPSQIHAHGTRVRRIAGRGRERQGEIGQFDLQREDFDEE